MGIAVSTRLKYEPVLGPIEPGNGGVVILGLCCSIEICWDDSIMARTGTERLAETATDVCSRVS